MYAAQCMGPDKYAQWTEVTVEELNTFIGFIILMVLVPIPALFDYWSRDNTFKYARIADQIGQTGF